MADPALDARRLRQGTKTGAWITVLPSMVDGTEMGSQECHDALYLCYGIEPPDLPTHCYGCNDKFSICHSMDCKKGGLIVTCHNGLRDGVADVASKAFTPSNMRNDYLVHKGRAMQEVKPQPVGSTPKNAPETTENF